MVVDVQPVKLDGQFFVSVIFDGHETNRHGPYQNRTEAEAMARRLSQFGRVLSGGIGRG